MLVEAEVRKRRAGAVGIGHAVRRRIDDHFAALGDLHVAIRNRGRRVDFSAVEVMNDVRSRVDDGEIGHPEIGPHPIEQAPGVDAEPFPRILPVGVALDPEEAAPFVIDVRGVQLLLRPPGRVDQVSVQVILVRQVGGAGREEIARRPVVRSSIPGICRGRGIPFGGNGRPAPAVFDDHNICVRGRSILETPSYGYLGAKIVR
mmetsp:Transcript_50021/g.106440  ORF Transcript_50021/g.106440 Transcript_50021/m.106440 type:complete len:203 (-) Transcript_50021:614-1222(-)